MNRDVAMILTGFAAGVGLMFLLDPDRGEARRNMMRDKLGGWANDAREMAEKQARHLGNKAQGLMADARSMIPGQAQG